MVDYGFVGDSNFMGSVVEKRNDIVVNRFSIDTAPMNKSKTI